MTRLSQARPRLKLWDLYIDDRWVGIVLGHDEVGATMYAQGHFKGIGWLRFKVKVLGNA